MAVVEDEDAAEAMVLLLERCKLVVEGAGAVGVAALLGGQVAPAERGTTVAVLSGGNVDPGLLLSIARRHETLAGRRLVRAHPRARPARARWPACSRCVAEAGGNIVDVSHVREGFDLHVRETAVELVLETRGREHADRVMRRDARGAATRRSRSNCSGRPPGSGSGCDTSHRSLGEAPA